MATLDGPSLRQQKDFILENASILGLKAQRALLSLVVSEVEQPVATDAVGVKGVDVDLDRIGELNPEVLRQMYNIIRAAREALSRPAAGPATDGRGGL